ncbi:uncharacterized protein LOC133814887 [Humulus lupulus]|uniref:uncharacterized protein LOC133814887 n=1 Tax=Humulus lupulus TaxID=3486 RepID=UPI002B4052A7|nr:uncharacterized protein LOC133814887 [Humulus lupulus]
MEESSEEEEVDQSNNIVLGFDSSDIFSTNLVFNLRESLIEWTKDKGKQDRIIIVIKRSYTGKSGKTRIKFACERSGSYRQIVKKIDGKKKKENLIEEHRQKKCGCPFLLSAHKLVTSDDWILKVVCGLHNHLSAKHLEGHLFARRMTKEETKIFVDTSKCNIMPREILVVIKEKNTHNVSTVRTIYNARQKHRVRE